LAPPLDKTNATSFFFIVDPFELNNKKNTQRHRKNKQENKHVIPESQRDILDLIYLSFGFLQRMAIIQIPDKISTGYFSGMTIILGFSPRDIFP
jgi:hypothetical protein